jgi:mRNA-degrading endonuclease RelE of RelBE toxin-antitoxin system
VSYLIALSAKAIKTLDRLDRKTEKRLQLRLEELATKPLDERISKRMETCPERRYSRVGAWRIVYEMEETAHKLMVITIQHRSRVYQEVKK